MNEGVRYIVIYPVRQQTDLVPDRAAQTKNKAYTATMAAAAAAIAGPIPGSPGIPAAPTELADGFEVVLASPRRMSSGDVAFHKPQTPVPTSFACG